MMICSHCGTQGEPRTYTRGCVIVEAVLWLAFIVPGILYSAWRRSTRFRGCPACEAPHMVPADSPQGAALLQQR